MGNTPTNTPTNILTNAVTTMLTVKVIRNHNDDDGLSINKNVIVSALQVKTDYIVDEHKFVTHSVVVEDYRGNVHAFILDGHTRIFVENSSGKTIQSYNLDNIRLIHK